MTESMDITQMFFCNLKLLGFDPAAMEKKYRIPFNKDMLMLPNKKGLEEVSYFLFSRLDSSRCFDEFRDCWPISDKKQEQQFRKIANNWLAQITKDDVDSHLPRLVSLFTSSSGEKLYQYMFLFSKYVLMRVTQQENGAKNAKEGLGHPVLTSQNSNIAGVISKVYISGATNLKERHLRDVRDHVIKQDEWTKYSDELVREYRNSIKTVRDRERDFKMEKQKLAERAASASHSPSKQKRRSGLGDYDYEIQAVKRADTLRNVRDLWGRLAELQSKQIADREIVDSILLGTVEKYKIDSSDLNIKVPDLLLRECEQEIQRRNVNNIYQGGKINLLSLIHLWNLSLHLYIERLHEAGLPNVEEALPDVTTMLHTHRAHLKNSESIRRRIETELLPDLKESIDRLKKELDDKLMMDSSPGSMRITSLGLGLLPPTPPVSFELRDPSQANDIKISEHISRRVAAPVLTPDAASQLMDDVVTKVRSRHAVLMQGTPIYGPRTFEKSSIPSKSKLASSKELKTANWDDPFDADPKLKKSNKESGNMVKPKLQTALRTSSNVSSLKSKPFQSQTARDRNVGGSKVGSVGKDRHQYTRPDAFKKSHHSSLSAKIESHTDIIASKVGSPKGHLDILADRIVEAVMSSTSPATSSLTSEHDDLFHIPLCEVEEDAFHVNDRLQRTPTNEQKIGAWHESLMEDSIGPLSSTQIEHLASPRERMEPDSVAIKLFPTSVFEHESHQNYLLKSLDRIPGREAASGTDTDSVPRTRTPSTIRSDGSTTGSCSDENIAQVSNSGALKDIRTYNHATPNDCKQKINAPDRDESTLVVGDSNRPSLLDQLANYSASSCLLNNRDLDSLHSGDEDESVDSLDEIPLRRLNDSLLTLQETETPRLPSRAKSTRGGGADPNHSFSKTDLDLRNLHSMIQNKKSVPSSKSDISLLKSSPAAAEVEMKDSRNFDRIGRAGSMAAGDSIHVSSKYEVRGTRPVGGEYEVRGTRPVGGEYEVQGTRPVGGEYEVRGTRPVGGEYEVRGTRPVGGEYAEDVNSRNTSLNKRRSEYKPENEKSFSAQENVPPNTTKRPDGNSADIDSLVARYKNIRSKCDGASEPFVPYVSSAVRNSPNVSEKFSQSTNVPFQFSADDILSSPKSPKKFLKSMSSFEKLIDEGLNEDFDDVRIKMLDISLSDPLTESPFSRKEILDDEPHRSFTIYNSVPVSDITDVVHSTDISFNKQNDSILDLQDHDDSLLLPTLLNVNGRESFPSLIDFS